MNEPEVLCKYWDIKKIIKQTGDYCNNLTVNIIQEWVFQKEQYT